MLLPGQGTFAVCVHVFEQWALPPDCTASVVLHDGQTCPSVAHEYGTTVEDLYELNAGAVRGMQLRAAPQSAERWGYMAGTSHALTRTYLGTYVARMPYATRAAVCDGQIPDTYVNAGFLLRSVHR